jgi:branched-chain amino acid transport system substrate-binding protein
MSSAIEVTDSAGWRIGVLYSRTGVTSVTESEHFFGTVLAIEEINANGGVLGRPLDPVAYDPKGDPDEYRRLAARLLLEDDINVLFGCSTSSSRKAVLPVVERTNSLLWYCSIYEGFEYSPNVIYTGAVPNQNSMQLAAYLLQHKAERFFLVGADYVYPRESNRIMRDMVEQHGGEIVEEIYLPSDASEEQLDEVIRDIRSLEPDVVFSTLIGVGARRFYSLYRDRGIDPQRIPIASLTMAEGETQLIGPERCEGHLTAATYFNNLDNDSNRRFLDLWRARFGEQPASMWSEMAYNQVHLFARALEKVGSLDTRKLVRAVHQVTLDSPEGILTIDPENNHCVLTPRIGICRADGRYDIVWQNSEPVKPDPYLSTYGFADFWLR